MAQAEDESFIVNVSGEIITLLKYVACYVRVGGRVEYLYIQCYTIKLTPCTVISILLP